MITSRQNPRLKAALALKGRKGRRDQCRFLAEGYKPSPELIKEIQDHVKKVTAPYKYPREIEFVKTLPKTLSGKVKRDILRKHAETGEAW